MNVSLVYKFAMLQQMEMAWLIEQKLVEMIVRYMNISLVYQFVMYLILT